MNYLLRSAIVIGAIALTGCASSNTKFHDLALFDRQRADTRLKLLMPFDAYVVGIEKDNLSRVGEMTECVAGQATDTCLNINAPFFVARSELRDALQDKYKGQIRQTYVSHIARFDGGEAPCFLYNLHNGERRCDQAVASPGGNSLIEQSWLALAAFGIDLDQRVATLRPSHILVYTMGWNTGQLEALDNFRRLARHLTSAAVAAGDAHFRPLVIGVTWPSTGMPLIPASDYGIKAKDADEVGAIWLNILLNRELQRVKKRHDFRVVVVGHSFGARASSRAVFSAPLVTSISEPVVDLLVGLQGAYSFQRYVAGTDRNAPEGREGSPYREHASQAGLVALTSSRYDTAVTKAGHRQFFVGSSDVFERTRTDVYRNGFIHASAGLDGIMEADPSCDPGRVLMIDASAIIIGNEPGTEGGAHSMIYTPQIGRLTYQLIKACAK